MSTNVTFKWAFVLKHSFYQYCRGFATKTVIFLHMALRVRVGLYND